MIIPIKQILVEDESLMGQMGQPVHQAEIPDPFEKLVSKKSMIKFSNMVYPY